MAVFYVLGCLVLIVIGWRTVPDTIVKIVSSAFTGQAAVGDSWEQGSVKQCALESPGLFPTNPAWEAPQLWPQQPKPETQSVKPWFPPLAPSGIVVVCALTGIVIVNSGEWMNGLSGAALTHAAFTKLPVVGSIILTVGLLTFAFSTILGWSYYSERAAEYLLVQK